MARKSSQQKNVVDRRSSSHKKKNSDSGTVPSDMKRHGHASEMNAFPKEEVPNGNQPSSYYTESVSQSKYARDEIDSKPKTEEILKEKQVIESNQNSEQLVHSGSNTGDYIESTSSTEASVIREETVMLPGSNHGTNYTKNILRFSLNGLHMKDVIENVDMSYNAAVQSLKASALSILQAANEWFETLRPSFIRYRSNISNFQDYVTVKFRQVYPVVLKFLMHLGNIMLLLSILWLDCTIRGLDSFLRMGMTSFFSVIWCSIFSVIAMVGMTKFLIVLAVAALVGVFSGLTLAVVVVAISGIVFLWIYGSFWITTIVIALGGLAFALSHERLALLITTVYSVYCAWMYVGWLGLLLSFNLSFLSSDALIYFLKNNINQQRQSEESGGTQGQPGFFRSEPMHASSSESSPGLSADRSPGVPSTSGTDSEVTSEDEVIRLLNCIDHYSALGFSRYANVDIAVLKREYRKKAMLVHPDKNMGNEKAVEAFKKLQNAYEVLLDSLKRKTYDDELRREELLDYFRRFQSTSQKNGKHRFFGSGFSRSEGDSEDALGESRRIACKKCSNFHIWVYTKKSKSRARWCQDCKEFHQAKDGDGWVEQSSQPFFFGLLQKVDAPCAYVCADGKIYDASEWYICQGMRCPANTHKPSFHVNTSLTSKHTSGKGTNSEPRGSRMPPNMEESMTEEEFFEWLQGAVQAGIFENSGANNSTDSPSWGGNGSNNNASNNASGSNSKRKKKGKKKW